MGWMIVLKSWIACLVVFKGMDVLLESLRRFVDGLDWSLWFVDCFLLGGLFSLWFSDMFYQEELLRSSGGARSV